MGVVHRSDDDGIVTLTLDDGKLNALDADVFREIGEAFEGCSDARAIVLAGREGYFTAGLNVKTLPTLDDAGLRDLLEVFGRTVMRIWLEPRPVVAACTGHAIAAGTMLAMACDHAVAAEGDYRWGLTETQIGFPLPEFGIALARGNVRADRLDDLLLPGAVIGPDAAAEAGFADEVAPIDRVIEVATQHATRLAQLPVHAYAATKGRLRRHVADGVLGRLSDDIADLVGARPAG